MIYISEFNDVEGDIVSVGFIHRMPFDEENGLGKSVEDIESDAGSALIHSLPDAERLKGKTSMLYFNKVSKDLWYEYSDLPPEPVDEISALKEETVALKMALIEQDIETSSEITSLKLAVLELDMALEILKEAY